MCYYPNRSQPCLRSHFSASETRLGSCVCCVYCGERAQQDRSVQKKNYDFTGLEVP